MIRLFTVLRERYIDRPGGYTRVWRTGWRNGDKAPLAIIEYVDAENDMKKYFQGPKGKEEKVEEKTQETEQRKTSIFERIFGK